MPAIILFPDTRKGHDPESLVKPIDSPANPYAT